MKIINKYYFVIISFCIIFIAVSPAEADLIAIVKGKAILKNYGITQYNYKIKNQELRDRNITDWGVSVAITADLRNIRCPYGWVVYYNPGDEQVGWEASVHPTYDLKPGMRAFFSFESAGRPSPQVYGIEGIDTDKQAVNGDTKADYIVGPGESVAPKPNGSVDMPSERDSIPCPSAYGPGH